MHEARESLTFEATVNGQVSAMETLIIGYPAKISNSFENAAYECLHFQSLTRLKMVGYPCAAGIANKSAFH